ncbi:hypothetical protein LTR66_006325 [Elasticomyces elasticus]|nr:hypothetical protein LTR50_003709 [Elasticomyces elasticus]KAK4992312.1 hypothetical protein LTR66_006325 [Elasticomyces elasticus]
MASKPHTGRAIVSSDMLSKGGWKMQDLTLRPIADNELIVDMVATGICHTDVIFGDQEDGQPGSFYPRVMGHEGACPVSSYTWRSGYVREVGSKVTVAKPGDPVLLSFAYCNGCHSCKDGHPAFCDKFNEINFYGGKDYTLSSSGGDPSKPDISGGFFGHSSFASVSIVNEVSVVNVKDSITKKEDLQLLAPFGCGIQTGSGTVANIAKASQQDIVAVTGLGGVGLSAIMAAKISGCRMIIGIDRIASRLELAKTLGATHTINTAELPEGKSVVDAVKEVAEGSGPSVSIDTTGLPALIRAAVEWTRNRGKICQVGTSPMDAKLDIPIFMFMISGKQFIGTVEGDSVPSEYVPKMIQWWRDGQFPVEKLVKYYKADDFETALHDMHSGEIVKPILLWS